jgi:hypothetical protein
MRSTGRAMSADVPDRSIAPVTVLTPIRPLWALWLQATWPGANRGTWIKGKVRDLEFLHFAHWGLVRRLPASRRGRSTLRLPTPYILFQSNYDGQTADYVETFAQMIPGRIRGMWLGGYQFPGTRPLQGFVRFVLDRAVPGGYHYYSAYPSGTVRTVQSALALRQAFDRFEREAADLPPDEFAAAWTAFLTSQQLDL